MKKYDILRKIIAVILVLAMIIGVDSFSVLAEEESVEESFEESVGDVSDSETDETDIVVNEKDDEEKSEEKDLGDEEDVLGAVSMSQSEYDSKMNAFINDSRWKDGTSWRNATKTDPGENSKLGPGKAWSCIAYAYDFVKYMYNLDGVATGQKYYGTSSIKAGDTIRINDVHTFVVLGRNGNNLYTAEGSYSNRVWISDSIYKIGNNNIINREGTNYTMSYGYHYVDITPGTADTTPPNIFDVQVQGTSNGSFKVSCKVNDDSGNVTVRMPTWTVEGGQDDIVWYDAKLKGDIWYCNVVLRDHDFQIGNYCTDIYAKDASGNEKGYRVLYWVSKNSESGGNLIISFEEPEKPVTDTEKPIVANARIDRVSKTTFTVSCTASDNVGLDKVEFPIWTENNGQDDLIWHQGYYSNGRWFCTINASDHNNEHGKYIIHVYAWDKAGNAGTNALFVYLDDDKIGSRMTVGAGQTLPDGDYYIVNGATTASAEDVENWYALDIDGTQIPCASDTNIHLWRNVHFSSMSCDVFTIRYKNDGFYEIRQKGTSMALDVDGGSNASNANIKMSNSNNEDAQSWSIERAPDIDGKGTGFYYLKARCSGFVVDAEGLNELAPSNDINISQYPIHSNNNINQKWRFVPVSGDIVVDGNYHILSAINTSKGIGIVDGIFNGESYHNAVIKNNMFNEEGVFSFKYNSDEKCYSIRHVSTGNYLDLQGAGKLSNVSKNVGVWESNPGTHQQWVLKNGGDRYGYIYIVSRFNGTNVAVMDAKDAEGQNVWPCWNDMSWSQKWMLARAVDSVDISETKVSLIKGETLMLYATINPSQAENKAVEWSSSNTDVVTVNDNGLITAKSVGTADVTVRTVDCGKTATCSVTVTASGEDNLSQSIGTDDEYIDQSDLSSLKRVTRTTGTTFFVGDSLLIDLALVDAKDIHVNGRCGTYRVVTDPDSGRKVGIITAEKKGKIKLYKLEGRKKKTVCTLKAELPRLKPSVQLKVGKTKVLKVKGTKISTDAWKTSNNDVVIVSSFGTIKAIKSGTADVTAIIGKHKFICHVTVK